MWTSCPVFAMLLSARPNPYPRSGEWRAVFTNAEPSMQSLTINGQRLEYEFVGDDPLVVLVNNPLAVGGAATGWPIR